MEPNPSGSCRPGRDEAGYIVTGEDIALQEAHRWPLDRTPMLLETTLPVFAAGDVRYGSVKTGCLGCG